MTNKPTIRERLDYLAVCDVAIAESERIAEQSKNTAFGEDTNDNYETVRQWKIIRERIATDLIKDPGFISYVSSLNSQLNEESTLPNHPLR